MLRTKRFFSTRVKVGRINRFGAFIPTHKTKAQFWERTYAIKFYTKMKLRILLLNTMTTFELHRLYINPLLLYVNCMCSCSLISAFNMPIEMLLKNTWNSILPICNTNVGKNKRWHAIIVFNTNVYAATYNGNEGLVLFLAVKSTFTGVYMCFCELLFDWIVCRYFPSRCSDTCFWKD